ncbi:MAG: hypothetical protein JJE47_14775 [Acidimicrobiia bacterium]|nr:hypothetical protein [Acidimicrobiia bacterium]
MIPIYWIAFGLGLPSLILWILIRGLADADVLVRFDPERRIPRFKLVVAGVLGFGMAGLSSSYAGWSTGMSVVAAAAGAVASAWYAHRVDDEPLSESPGPSGDSSAQHS